MWLPILVTVLAAAGNNIGKVLQKQATRTLPRMVLQPAVLSQYFSSKAWLVGMASDLGGALLMIVAFALAPVSVVQPVSAVGLVILMIFSHFYLKERLKAREWGSACIAFTGVLGLGMTSEPDHLQHPDHLHPGRILLSFMVMVGLLGLECWVRHARFQQMHSMVGLPAGRQTGSGTYATPGGPPHSNGVGTYGYVSSPVKPAAIPAYNPAAADAVLCGLEGGACFGFSAAACRTGFILGRRLTWAWVPLGLLGSMLLTSSGFVLQTRGLKAGNTVVVCTMAAVASMVTGVLAGLVVLHEKMPTAHHLKVARLVSWGAILVGVSSLAGGPDGMSTVGRALSTVLVSCSPRVPRWASRFLPLRLQHMLHKAQKRLAAAAQEDLHVLPVAQAELIPGISAGV